MLDAVLHQQVEKGGAQDAGFGHRDEHKLKILHGYRIKRLNIVEAGVHIPFRSHQNIMR